MRKYRKKPVVIEAIIWNGDNIEEIKEFVGESFRCETNMFLNPYVQINKHQLSIITLEGEMNASIGDYIIKGIKGEFYPCKPTIFEASYEIVQE